MLTYEFTITLKHCNTRNEVTTCESKVGVGRKRPESIELCKIPTSSTGWANSHDVQTVGGTVSGSV